MSSKSKSYVLSGSWPATFIGIIIWSLFYYTIFYDKLRFFWLIKEKIVKTLSYLKFFLPSYVRSLNLICQNCEGKTWYHLIPHHIRSLHREESHLFLSTLNHRCYVLISLLTTWQVTVKLLLVSCQIWWIWCTPANSI